MADEQFLLTCDQSLPLQRYKSGVAIPGEVLNYQAPGGVGDNEDTEKKRKKVSFRNHCTLNERIF